jgi:hypothetical protein
MSTTASKGSATTEWNTRAVAYLQEGDVDKCVLIIKDELACVRADFEKFAAQEGDHESMDLEDGQERPCFPAIHSVPLSCDDKASSLWDSPNNLFSFFPRAFVLEQDHAVTGKDQGNDARYAVVLLYNLALAYHTEAARHFQRKGASCYMHQRSLDAAVRLYQSALQIADSSWDEADFEDGRCLLLATLNNLGFISSHRMEFLETCHCIGMMCELIDLENAAYASSNGSSLSDTDFELFFQSVFTFLDPASQLHLAPAA